LSKLVLGQNPTLADLQQYVRDLVKERHFDEADAALPHKFMMLFEEVGEFAKASRKAAGMKLAGDAEKQNAAHEAADVLIVLLGLCNMLGIDLEAALREKEEINKRRVWS
jgi:NTP pyrophosphatase (non-canonical NTP hydrolase)